MDVELFGPQPNVQEIFLSTFFARSRMPLIATSLVLERDHKHRVPAAWAIECHIVAVSISFNLDAVTIHDQEVSDLHSGGSSRTIYLHEA